MLQQGLRAVPAHLVAVLSRVTALVLGVVQLLPALLLLLMTGFTVLWLVDGVLGLTPEPTFLRGAAVRADIDEFAFGAMPLLAAVATLVARAGCRLQLRFSGLSSPAGEPDADDVPWGVAGRVLRYLYGPSAWAAVFHSTVIGLWGVVSGLAVLVLGAIGVGLPLGLLALLGFVVVGLVRPDEVAWPATIAAALLSTLLALVAAWLARAADLVESEVVRGLLVDTPQQRARRRMEVLSETRMRMVDAAEAERRRVERDLHDGAQQRLLAVTMTLARARSALRRDTDQAGALVEQAHTEAKEAMTELRDVARGLHPRVLTDHGLSSALPLAAGRCSIPVHVRADLPGRPTARAEGVAYYVACEALTNVAKHSTAATSAQVRATRVQTPRGALLRLAVEDDGEGGAQPDAGSGLYGLWDRVHAVDGEFTVHSPPGGPTVITADIPWEA